VEITPERRTQLRSEEVDGHSPCRSPNGQIDPRKVNKPATGHFDKAGVTLRRHLTEAHRDAAEALGQEIVVDIFEAARRSMSSGPPRVFRRVMKRHNSRVSRRLTVHTANHRKPGSIGASSTPSRVQGMRMAGPHGWRPVTAMNLSSCNSVDPRRT
jgi:large subunit ribosomal protein L3